MDYFGEARELSPLRKELADQQAALEKQKELLAQIAADLQTRGADLKVKLSDEENRRYKQQSDTERQHYKNKEELLSIGRANQELLDRNSSLFDKVKAYNKHTEEKRSLWEKDMLRVFKELTRLHSEIHKMYMKLPYSERSESISNQAGSLRDQAIETFETVHEEPRKSDLQWLLSPLKYLKWATKK